MTTFHITQNNDQLVAQSASSCPTLVFSILFAQLSYKINFTISSMTRLLMSKDRSLPALQPLSCNLSLCWFMKAFLKSKYWRKHLNLNPSFAFVTGSQFLFQGIPLSHGGVGNIRTPSLLACHSKFPTELTGSLPTSFFLSFPPPPSQTWLPSRCQSLTLYKKPYSLSKFPSFPSGSPRRNIPLHSSVPNFCPEADMETLKHV